MSSSPIPPSTNSDEPALAAPRTFRALHITTALDHMLFIAPLAAQLLRKLGLPEPPEYVGPSLPPGIDFDNPPWEKVTDAKPLSPY